ncbi:sulfurtransferase [Putridiphycobacter roseus]|uniref:Sulfurtransferase n=1 Tax=Putridiphycobacter roseus TaxID=2219161 RepID=A0A2W1N420_9FLAO|nr:rhodanese-like domain-containing protein [Putridiphycobacter roseus]PZE17801.1 sulfurtransferase [Putridiphycobacter roseus]
MTPITSVNWLKQNIHDPALVILDAGTDPSDTKIIPGARVFDLKHNFQRKNSPYPNTYPLPEQFELECQKLGIQSSSKIIIYDHKGVYTSPRVWWLFQLMGHTNVSVLDGGLPAWEEAGFKISIAKKEITWKTGDFKAHFQPNWVKHFEDIQQHVDQQKFKLIDARSSGRFMGTAPEPREGLRSGAIPHTINIPYTTVLENGKFKSIDKLTPLFKEIMHEGSKTVFTCGSGITACIILLASELVYQGEKAVYDGSWTEWALHTK